jgi:hypothetical protein
MHARKTRIRCTWPCEFKGMQAIRTTKNQSSSPSNLLAMSTRTKAKALLFAAAGLSFILSIWLWFRVDREQGLFVGLWVPSILSFGGVILAEGGKSRE